MSVLLAIGLLLIGAGLDRLWQWAQAADEASYNEFIRREAQDRAIRDMVAHTRRAEEQIRRVTFFGGDE